jgi:histidinol-phosphatase (PHP family)
MQFVSRYDYHVHDSFSRDAPEASLESIIEIGEKKGLEEICFTSHLIVEGPDKKLGLQPNEIETYIENILKNDDDTIIKLRIGFEVDYFPEKERYIEKLLEEYSVDFILGSTHYINGIDIGSRIGAKKFFKDRQLSEAIDEYFTTWSQAIYSGLFDVMAHPDYWKKFLIDENKGQINWKNYGDEVYSAIFALADNDIGFEVNTSAVRGGWDSFYPLKEFLRHAKEYGVEKVTIGSDTHSPENLGHELPNAVKQLEEAGFQFISVFSKRKDGKIPIDQVTKEFNADLLNTI